MELQYMRCHWYHELDEPILIYMELDTERFDMRKVEIYADGKMTWADSTHATGNSMLNVVPVPDLDDINAESEFFAEMIEADDFQSIWDAAIQQR